MIIDGKKDTKIRSMGTMVMIINATAKRVFSFISNGASNGLIISYFLTIIYKIILKSANASLARSQYT